MEVKRKLAVLADAAKYDASCASSGAKRRRPKDGIGNSEGMGICHSYTPDGRCVSLLKILFTNFCIYDCQYCVNRLSSDVERARFTPDEVVQLTLAFYRRNYIEGLFLSSGVIKSADYTLEQLTLVAKKLRLDERFGGYIHLKAPPGASQPLIAAAALYADRISVNIELPRQSDLQTLAPGKTHAAIESVMGALHDGIAARGQAPRAPRFAPAGQSTQMIVGASAASDHDILGTATRLYGTYRLRRVYYSAFSPIPFADQRLPAQAPPMLREHRLYEADWLLRFYGFSLTELLDETDPNLDLRYDPKLAWALRHRHLFPVDINRADREMLLRIPGFGVRSVQRILQMRRHRAVRQADLQRLRLPLKRAAAFLVAPGAMQPALRQLDSLSLAQRLRPAEQLSLFDAQRAALSGEL